MTLFEFVVPLIALAIALVGALILRREGQKLDRMSDEPPSPPAE